MYPLWLLRVLRQYRDLVCEDFYPLDPWTSHAVVIVVIANLSLYRVNGDFFCAGGENDQV